MSVTARVYGEYRNTGIELAAVSRDTTGQRTRRKRTVSHPKDNAGLLHGSFYLETLINRRGHRLLAHNIISLSSKGLNGVRMQTILNGDDNCIRKAPPGRLYALCRSLVKLLPRFKDECVIKMVSTCEEYSCLRSGFCNCYYLALCGLYQSIFCVSLI